MKPNTMLTTTSLLAIVLMACHYTDDVLHEGGLAVNPAGSLITILILFVWLYGTLVLGERRSGHIVMLVGSLLATGIPVIHVLLARTVLTNEAARARGDYFFVWTLLALGVTALFSVILSARGLWRTTAQHKQGAPA